VGLRRWNIVKDDFVQVITGRYKNTQGKVLHVYRDTNQVLVAGVNLKYKRVDDEEMVRRRKTVQKESPVHVSNVSLLDPESGKPTRIKYGFLEDGLKVRISKKSGALIPKPDRTSLKYMNRTKGKEAGPNDTKAEDVLEKSYRGEDFLRVKAEFDEYIRIKDEKEGLLVFKDRHQSL
jgi:large subunit ribosomal protein L24